MDELIKILEEQLSDLNLKKEDEEKYLSMNMRMMLAESREFRKKIPERLKKYGRSNII